MKKLVLKPSAQYAEDQLPDDEDFSNHDQKDCERIIEICKENGYEIDLLTAYNAWSEHSMDFCASWLFVDDDGKVMWAILRWCDVKETE